jgi:hypothetical protein
VDFFLLVSSKQWRDIARDDSAKQFLRRSALKQLLFDWTSFLRSTGYGADYRFGRMSASNAE